MPKTGCNWSDGTAEPTPSSGSNGIKTAKHKPAGKSPSRSREGLLFFAKFGARMVQQDEAPDSVAPLLERWFWIWRETAFIQK